ncbi:MAG: PA2169 family four-helix-bundle protein [Hymenobacteraceae bacterium]|nr:PA2169 family four-helix-bundle protein [Hymenobacteraceae bacterium]MDX5394648.1 PA2169 family four-helix-bundle protein [Hymenobacteraceae bacterium]MDX5442877.1 PA2169 family four-helix-bundle protein [Hymenobacteraceae bacterium]MDX5510679.1 PA2169 family four-helix-bundle protein [Hymenobacteraceae bacterium]
MKSEKEVIAVVHHLIERCKDGEKGYRTAAEDVRDQDLKDLFKKYAVQRDSMITELQNQLHKMGKLDDESSSIEGTMHRAWIDLKSAISSHDRKRILEECERGEDYAVAAYRKAMDEELPGELKTVVEKQYNEVKQAHDRIRDLRDQAKA